MFNKTSKAKIYKKKKMTADDSTSYLPYLNKPYLNKLVDQYNYTYQHSINKETY